MGPFGQPVWGDSVLSTICSHSLVSWPSRVGCGKTELEIQPAPESAHLEHSYYLSPRTPGPALLSSHPPTPHPPQLSS